MNFRKMSPSTRCLYSAASICARNLSALAQSTDLKSRAGVSFFPRPRRPLRGSSARTDASNASSSAPTSTGMSDSLPGMADGGIKAGIRSLPFCITSRTAGWIGVQKAVQDRPFVARDAWNQLTMDCRALRCYLLDALLQGGLIGPMPWKQRNLDHRSLLHRIALQLQVQDNADQRQRRLHEGEPPPAPASDLRRQDQDPRSHRLTDQRDRAATAQAAGCPRHWGLELMPSR